MALKSMAHKRTRAVRHKDIITWEHQASSIVSLLFAKNRSCDQN